MGKFTIADWTVSLAGAGFFAYIGSLGHGIMLGVSTVIILISAWRSIRREIRSQEDHEMGMKERQLKLDREAAKKWYDPDEEANN